LLAIWQYLLPATKILDSWELWRITVDSGVEIVTARDLLLSLVAFALTFFGVRNIPGMLELLLLQRLPLDAGARYAVASILRYILLVVGVIVALSYLKIPWSNYSWLVAAISVGLGFGLQEIVANFVSGLILLLERPVRVGDVVTIDGVTGIVSRIQMRATTVTNWDNQELVVPNKDLISGKLLNWTLSSVINRIALKVGVAYGTDVAKVREIITKIVDRHPDVLHDPPPVITFEEFGDSSLNFVIRCCTTSIKRRWHLVDEINSAVNEAFEREGIEIPFPQRVLHMIQEDESPEIEDEN
jgi:potassium efflux system protein